MQNIEKSNKSDINGNNSLSFETEKEFKNVQTTNESCHESFLRRIIAAFNGTETEYKTFASVLIKQLIQLSTQGVFQNHLFIIECAVGLQLYIFSNGKLFKQYEKPLWNELTIQGRGLRRFSFDYIAHADKLLKAFELPGSHHLLKLSSVSPIQLCRLAHYELALERARNTNDLLHHEVTLRKLISTHPNDPLLIQNILNFSGDSQKQIRLAAAQLAQCLKLHIEHSNDILNMIHHWINQNFKHSKIIDSETAITGALAFNAINFLLLKQQRSEELEFHLQMVADQVIPNIRFHDDRNHILGNYHYQRSILLRIQGDIQGELHHLYEASKKDINFSTVFYRIAQIFHDRLDIQAKFYYEKALSLSPLDYPTSNDYGCFLSETGSQDELQSWSIVCQKLFPENFLQTIEEKQ